MDYWAQNQICPPGLIFGPLCCWTWAFLAHPFLYTPTVYQPHFAPKTYMPAFKTRVGFLPRRGWLNKEFEIRASIAQIENTRKRESPQRTRMKSHVTKEKKNQVRTCSINQYRKHNYRLVKTLLLNLKHGDIMKSNRKMF